MIYALTIPLALLAYVAVAGRVYRLLQERQCAVKPDAASMWPIALVVWGCYLVGRAAFLLGARRRVKLPRAEVRR